MSVDLKGLTAHLAPQQQADIAKAYHRDAEHSTTAFLYCFFLGTLGAHRFYLRQWRKGFGHLILPVLIAAVLVAGIALKWSPLLVVAIVIPLALVALVWEIIDLFTIDHEVYTRNLKLAEGLIAGSLLADHTVERRADAKLESMLHDTQTQAATATSRDQAAADAEGSVVVSREAQAVAEPAPALIPGDVAAAETVSEQTRQDSSAALSSAEYVAATTTQISETPEEAQRAQASSQTEPDSWSETESYHAGALEAAGGAASAEEMTAGGATTEAESATAAEAQTDDFSFDQSLTRSHDASAFSVTDSAELMTTMAVADSAQTEEQATIEEEAPLTPQEADAPTWPDHDPVHFDEPEPVAAQSESSWGAMDALAGAAVLATASGAFSGGGVSSPGPDATDMSQYPDSVETIADIEGAGAAPLYVSLPDEPVAAQPSFFDPTDTALPSDDQGMTGGAGDLGDGLVVFIPEQIGANDGTTDVSDSYAPVASEPVAFDEPPAQAYVPPTVPVITTLGAPDAEATTSAQPGSAFATNDTPEWLHAEPRQEPATEESQSGSGETLAEVAGAAAFGVAAGAVYEDFSRHQNQPSGEQAPSAVEPDAAVTAEPSADATPGGMEPTPVLPDASTDATAAEAGVVAGETAHHRKRHIRVVRQVKVGGEVIEEMAAEEYINEDDDPEPVRKRLEAMLRQQASGAISGTNLPEGSGAGAE